MCVLYITFCMCVLLSLLSELCFFFQAEDGIRDLVRSRGLGDVYKRQVLARHGCGEPARRQTDDESDGRRGGSAG